jgi:phage gp36-like protein
MAYATPADVQARVPTQLLTLGAGSQPSAAQVTAWLAAASAWIDATLAWKYLAPVTAAPDAALLAPVCAALVAAQVWTVISGHDAKLAANAGELRREALQLLAYDARTGQSRLVLSQTALADSGEAAVNQPEGTFTDPDQSDGATHARLFWIGMEL